MDTDVPEGRILCQMDSLEYSMSSLVTDCCLDVESTIHRCQVAALIKTVSSIKLITSLYATNSKYFENSASFLSKSCSPIDKCTRTSKTFAVPCEKFGKIIRQAPAMAECIRNATGTEAGPRSYFSALPEYQVFMKCPYLRSLRRGLVSPSERGMQ
ncbi:hypothetical protein MAP00_001703 [Monascus purpureus]|nr:hypothetical protein MAP00_001703 [Monascus purpureus]